jgi:hypothetical protein
VRLLSCSHVFEDEDEEEEERGGEGRGRRFREMESDLSRIDFLMRLDDFQHTSDDLASVQVLVGGM